MKTNGLIMHLDLLNICSNRLGEDPTDHDSVFNKINDFFDWLPLAAVIEDRIVCLHGGIGSTLVSLE